jgi:hypothetical protein
MHDGVRAITCAVVVLLLATTLLLLLLMLLQHCDGRRPHHLLVRFQHDAVSPVGRR